MLEENNQYANQDNYLNDQYLNYRRTSSNQKQNKIQSSVEIISRIDLVKQYNELRQRASLQKMKLQFITTTNLKENNSSQLLKRPLNQTCTILNSSNCELISQINQKTQEFAKEKVQQIQNANQLLQEQLKEVKVIQEEQLLIMNQRIQQIQENYNNRLGKLQEQYEREQFDLKKKMENEIAQEQENVLSQNQQFFKAKNIIEDKLENLKESFQVPTSANTSINDLTNTKRSRVNNIQKYSKTQRISSQRLSFDKSLFFQQANASTCANEIDHLKQSIQKLKSSVNCYKKPENTELMVFKTQRSNIRPRNKQPRDIEQVSSEDEEEYYKDYLQFKRAFLEKEKGKYKMQKQ